MLNMDPLTLVARLLTLVISLTFHEFAHAWTAHQFGDDTARAAGRMSLNPLVHLDPIGSIMLIVAGFGWAKPVPVNPYALKKRSGLMWVSLAGPLSNFLLALIAIVPIRLNLIPLGELFSNTFIGTFLLQFIIINLSLMLFNLLPIFPLDGEKIASYAWPPAWSNVLEKISRFGPILLLVVWFGPYIGLNIFGAVIQPPLMNLLTLMMGYPLF